MMDQFSNTAVHIKNASKSFGKKSVLHNLNMHVEKGTIYGLLGSSGCGKTTLLNIIVGRKKLDAGTVWVLGGPPGTADSGVPGPLVGYMPQDVALVAEFTVKSVIYYFGRIFCLSEKEIEDKLSELTRLLDLPPPNRFIADCSGGQQRRVSFAAALVSAPELLILDEPTVGLDPLLREGIWDYLLQLAKSNLTSVVITTHYIEETRQAHKIGLMRHGKLLAEESPEMLLDRFGTHSLEDVFFTLSKNEAQATLAETVCNDKVPDPNVMGTHSTSSTMVLSELQNSRKIITPKTEPKCFKPTNKANIYGLNCNRIKALLGKSWLQVAKNYSGIGFMFVFPIVQVLAFFMAVGDDVKDIKIGVTNHEDNFGTCDNYIRNNSAIPYEDGDCKFERLGCYFLQQLNDSMINAVFYDDTNKSSDAIKHGIITGYLYIPENFSESFHDKLIDGAYDTYTLDHGQVQVWLDMSNRQIGSVIKAKLVDKILKFQKSLFADCNILERVASIPINLNEHMYGSLDDTFTAFMAPAVILMSLYFLASSNAANLMVTDRLEGIWDRSIVAGVSSLEIVLVHFVTQFIIMTIQGAIVLIITFFIYKTTNDGSFVVVIVFILLSGVSGISYGFFVSVVSNSHSMSHIIATGSFFPLILLCGFMWPIEGMPTTLLWISHCLPLTIPITSLRNVMRKGWSLLHKDVINGIGVQLLWTVILLVISIIIIQRRK